MKGLMLKSSTLLTQQIIFTVCFILLAFGCKKETNCESPIHLGEFLLLDSSISKGELYESYNKVKFVNQNSDTLSFLINYQETINYHNRICFYQCKEDNSQEVIGEYDVNSKTTGLNIQPTNVETEIEFLSLTISTILHLDDPELKLVGDFISLYEYKYADGYERKPMMNIPIDLRNYPVPVQDLTSSNYFENMEINGASFYQVFSSNQKSESDLKILFNLEFGILEIEESNGVKWHLSEYE